MVLLRQQVIGAMDTGSLVVDLVSAVIVASVFAIAVVYKDPSTDTPRSESEAGDYGFFEPGPSEGADEENAHRN